MSWWHLRKTPADSQIPDGSTFVEDEP